MGARSFPSFGKGRFVYQPLIKKSRLFGGFFLSLPTFYSFPTGLLSNTPLTTITRWSGSTG
jgi:hypothetical protein